MTQAKLGDRVRVHYKLFLNDGTIFDSSLEREPLEFIIGEGMVIPGFENAVIGMNEGETKNISLHPEEAYGPYRNDLVFVVGRSMVPPDIDPQVGMGLQVRSPKGIINVIITDVSNNTITLDGNHPLAGKELNFEVKLLNIL